MLRLAACCFFYPFRPLPNSRRSTSALIEIHDGITISNSLFLLNLRFRMQNQVGFTTVSGDDLSAASVDARVRRLRLRLDGYVKKRALALLHPTELLAC